MQGNTYGRLFRITTCGESYGIGKGSALLTIVDGVPAGLSITREIIQDELDKRRPGSGELDSPRKETDRCELVAGIGQEGRTTGAPLGIIVYNTDTEQEHIEQYRGYKDLIRPGHAEYTHFVKYGEFADWCGAGRASGRETVSRVAGGAVAKHILWLEGIEVIGYTKQCLDIKAREMSYAEVKQNYRKNEINCPDLEAAVKMREKVLEAKENGDTAGGIVEIICHNVPAGLGEPVFDKLSAMLAHGLCSIGSVKGIEFGAGFGVAEMLGSENNDLPYVEEKEGKKRVRFQTNNAGGLLGGISSGEDIVIRLAIKPTPTISLEQQSVDMSEVKEKTLVPITRRDPTLLGRIYAVAEAMTAVTIVDALMMARAYDAMEDPKSPWRQI